MIVDWKAFKENFDTSNIFTLKDTAKMHCSNTELNVPNNAPLAVY
jgi:hypothetical protein